MLHQASMAQDKVPAAWDMARDMARDMGHGSMGHGQRHGTWQHGTWPERALQLPKPTPSLPPACPQPALSMRRAIRPNFLCDVASAPPHALGVRVGGVVSRGCEGRVPAPLATGPHFPLPCVAGYRARLRVQEEQLTRLRVSALRPPLPWTVPPLLHPFHSLCIARVHCKASQGPR